MCTGIETIENEVKTILRKHISDVVELNSVEAWSGGFFNKCYKILTKNPEKTYFLKMELDKIYPTTKKAQIEREVYGLKLLRNQGIRCAEVYGYDFNGIDIGKRYVLTEFFEGDLLFMSWDGLNDKEKNGITSEISYIIDCMSNVPAPYFGDYYNNGYLGKHKTWQEFYRAIGKLLLTDCVELNILSEQEIAIIRKAIEKEKTNCSAEYTPGFFHQDLGMHNIIFNSANQRGKQLAVIDCGNAFFTLSHKDEVDLRARGEFGLVWLDVFEKYGLNKKAYEAQVVDGLDWVVRTAYIKQMNDYSHCPDPIKEGIESVKSDTTRFYIDEFLEKCQGYLNA